MNLVATGFFLIFTEGWLSITVKSIISDAVKQTLAFSMDEMRQLKLGRKYCWDKGQKKG